MHNSEYEMLCKSLNSSAVLKNSYPNSTLCFSQNAILRYLNSVPKHFFEKHTNPLKHVQSKLQEFPCDFPIQWYMVFGYW